jgi:hypothetical protein
MRLTDKPRQALTDLWHKLALLPASRKASFGAVGLALMAFGAAGVAPLAPDAADLPVATIAEELALPDLSTQISALREASAPFIVAQPANINAITNIKYFFISILLWSQLNGSYRRHFLIPNHTVRVIREVSQPHHRALFDDLRLYRPYRRNADVI